jgi:PKD repeat protein
MIRPRRTQFSRMPARPRSNERGPTEFGSQPTRRGRRAMRQLVMLAVLVVPALVAVQVVFAAQPSGTFEISDNTPSTGQTVTFTPQNVQDPDGGTASVSSFDYGDGSPVDTDGTWEHAYTATGTKTVTMTISAPPFGAEDPASPPETTQVTRTVNVSQGNQPPTAVIGCTPTAINQGDAVTCSSAGSSDDGGITEYAWRIGDSGAFSVDGPTFSPTSLAPGANNIWLQVKDNSGLADTASATVTVNAKPQASFTIAAQNPLLNQFGDPNLDQVLSVPLVDQSIKLDGTASSDPGGSITKYEWAVDLNNDGTFDSAIGSGATLTVPPGLPPGNMTIKLTVTDSSNATAEKTLPLRVNRRPESNFVVEPVTPVINQAITFSSAATDADVADGHGDSLTHAWAIDRNRNGTFEASENAGTATSITASFTTAGTYPVRLRVKDAGGIAAEKVRNVLVQNTIPKGGFTWSPNSPLPDEAVTFSGSPSVATAGKSITGYQWDLNYDPTKDQFDVDASGVSVSHAFPTAGTKTVALKVTETGGGYAIVFDRITVNAPPVASFSISPASVFTGDPVTLSSTAGDPDGPLAKQEWDLDNDGQYDDAGGGVVFATFARAGSFPLKLRVTDSKGATAVAVRQVDVANRPVVPPSVLPGVLIEFKGRLAGKFTELTRLLVRSPKGSKVVVRCAAPRASAAKLGCPKRLASKSKGRKKLRFKKLERKFAPGARLIVSVTKKGFIGKYTTVRMRRGKPPLRQDLCLWPGAKKGKACPS